jgi:hypothetical protein
LGRNRKKKKDRNGETERVKEGDKKERYTQREFSSYFFPLSPSSCHGVSPCISFYS